MSGHNQPGGHLAVPAALRRCEHCGKPQDAKVKIKRCARCAGSVYCSRECQKAAWAFHKNVCRTPDERDPLRFGLNLEVLKFGFPDVDQYRHALEDFIEVHTWAFQSYARALLLLEGGPQYMNTPPRILQIKLRCLCTPTSSLNPACTFAFSGHQWRTVEEYKTFYSGATNWDESAALREAAHKQGSRSPGFYGMLPIIYMAEDAHASQTHLYSQYERNPRYKNGPEPDLQRRILTDIHTLCTRSINLGLALRCAEGQESVAALPGRFTRSRGRWTWTPLFPSWEEYFAGPSRIPEVEAMYQQLPGNTHVDVEHMLILIRVL